MSTLGVDIARYQGNPAPIKAIVKAGAGFIIAKATEGTGYVDPSFAKNMALIKASTAVPGNYHFLWGGDGAGQCDHFLDTIGNPNGLICAVDVETVRSGPDPEYADVKAFVKRFRDKAPGHPLVLYTGAWFWTSRQFGNPDASALDLFLWNARYTGAKGPLDRITRAAGFRAGYGGWTTADIVQFTSLATLPNGGRIDVDLAVIDPKILTHKPTVPPPPPPVPIEQRPRYRAGYNEAVAKIRAFAAAYEPPQTPNPADDAGAKDARDAMVGALDGLELGDGS